MTLFRDSQPGGRAGAPGELGVVQDFINTANFDTREDDLGDPSALKRFLSQHGLLPPRAKVTEGDLARALELREALRGLAAANNGQPLSGSAVAVLNLCARRAGLAVAFGRDGRPREVQTARGVDRAVGELLAIVYRAMRNDSWPRLKTCQEHGCRWVFYDQSRNRKGTWCTMELCGTRAKMRTYRARRAVQERSPTG
jgi:predicted RNA-binding Zn ribbon-like protein